MACKMRICGIEPESIVDGRGIRDVVFAQGCPRRCPSCHNPQSHPFDGGKLIDIYNLFNEIRKNPLLKGVTLSGGEPFAQPEPMAELAWLVHGIGLDVTAYTGYLYEELLAMNNEAIHALLAQTDILIDGPFILGEKDLTLRFRDSRNQRVIDMEQTRLNGRVIQGQENES